jgi:hypothetical protein
MLGFPFRDVTINCNGAICLKPGCRGTACRTLLVPSRDKNEEGTASRTPTTRRCPVTILKNWMLQHTSMVSGNKYTALRYALGQKFAQTALQFTPERGAPLFCSVSTSGGMIGFQASASSHGNSQPRPSILPHGQSAESSNAGVGSGSPASTSSSNSSPPQQYAQYELALRPGGHH